MSGTFISPFEHVHDGVRSAEPVDGGHRDGRSGAASMPQRAAKGTFLIVFSVRQCTVLSVFGPARQRLFFDISNVSSGRQSGFFIQALRPAFEVEQFAIFFEKPGDMQGGWSVNSVASRPIVVTRPRQVTG